MSENIVISGAKLSCSLGTQDSNLCVPVSHGMKAKGENVALISDSKSNINIIPFCMCTKSYPPVPCTPTVAMQWINGKNDCTLGNIMLLLDRCIVTCSFGGIITIKDNGQ